IHLVVCIEGTDKFVSKCDMMRADFTGDLDAPSSGVTQQSDTARRTEMLAMEARFAEIGQKDISGHHDFLSGSRPARQSQHRAPKAFMHYAVSDHVIVLAVIEYGEVEHARIFDSAAHQLMVLNAMPIVRYCYNPRLNHGPYRRHLLTLQALGNCSGWVDIDVSGVSNAIAY